MIRPKYIPLVLKQVTRNGVRSGLTLAGVATAMFLYVAIEAMQRGVAEATQTTAADTTLVVYRKDRFCPFSSRLPEYYLAQIERLEGVRAVVPVKIVLSNCRASLDVVTFRGVPRDRFAEDFLPQVEILAGSVEDWKKRSDAALVGESLAERRRLRPGDRFDSAGVTSYVAGILRSDEPQDENVAYVHLDFLQQVTDRKLGIVTQFNVKVTNPAQLDPVSDRIDALFAAAEHPTTTRSEKAFVAHVAAEAIALISFTRYLGWACLAAVLALVGNAIVLAVQSRIKDHAILRTLGYTAGHIGRLIIAEGIALGILGGVLGSVAAVVFLRWSRLTLSVDGLSLPVSADWRILGIGLLTSVALGVVAGLVPAWQASRRQIAGCFRAV